jgi:hypothetical protein
MAVPEVHLPVTEELEVRQRDTKVAPPEVHPQVTEGLEVRQPVTEELEVRQRDTKVAPPEVHPQVTAEVEVPLQAMVAVEVEGPPHQERVRFDSFVLKSKTAVPTRIPERHSMIYPAAPPPALEISVCPALVAPDLAAPDLVNQTHPKHRLTRPWKKTLVFLPIRFRSRRD